MQNFLEFFWKIWYLLENNNTMGQRLILSEEERRNIQEMYGLINEQTTTGCTQGDCINGRGTYIWADGDKYEGEWKDDYFNGQGTYTWSSGNKYEGEWKDGDRNGKATYTWADGDKYEGEWKDDKKDGKGTFKCVNGTEFEQTWEKGNLISGDVIDCSSGSGKYPLPENWKNGILNKGWIIMKGSHSQDKKYPGAKDAIKFVQDKVGTKVDGLFGPNTESAVEKYQDENDLKVDGKVGKQTLSSML